MASGELEYTCEQDIQEILKHLQEIQSRNDKKRKQRLREAKSPFDYYNTDYFIIDDKYIRAQDLARKYNCTGETIIRKAYRGEIKYDDITFDLEAKYNHIVTQARIHEFIDKRKRIIKNNIANEYKAFGIELNNDQLNEIYERDITDTWDPSTYDTDMDDDYNIYDDE